MTTKLITKKEEIKTIESKTMESKTSQKQDLLELLNNI